MIEDVVMERLSETIKQINEEVINPLTEKLEKLKEEKMDFVRASMVGKHMIYRKNCYSCPQNPSDYWNIYMKIIGEKDGKLQVFSFQKDKDGDISIHIGDIGGFVYPDGTIMGYEEITEREFNQAKKKILLKEIDNLMKKGIKI